MRFDLVGVKQAVLEGRLTWQQHALQRLIERHLIREDVIEAILHAEIIEEYPCDYPLPSALVLCWNNRIPLHVVVAWDAEAQRAYIITVYIPDKDHFTDDQRTRRTER